MSLDGLPSEILLRILQYLPFDERIRIARVNRQFNGVSLKITSQTKSIDLTSPIFRRITTESMRKMIDLFSGNLEKVIFNDSWWQTKRERNIINYDDDCGNSGTLLPFFLRHCQNLNHLDLRAVIELKDIRILRNNSLKSLVLEYYDDISDQFFSIVSVTFPQLERLELIAYSGRINSPGMEYLAKLKHLRFFKIIYKYRGSVNMDTIATDLIRCKYLHCVQFHHQLRPTTIHAFTRNCTQLRQLIIENIRGIDSPNSATSFVLSLSDFVQENLSILIKNGDSEIWKCQEVESAVTEINKSGRCLSIEIPSNVDDGKIFYPSPYSSQKRWYQNVIDWTRRLLQSI